MLVLDGITKQFGGKLAVENVSAFVPTGQFVGIIGRSGAGKSTLLRMINRLADPTSGRMSWNNRDITTIRGRELREWRRSCAMIFQQFNLVGRLDVMTNVMMGRIGAMNTPRALLKLWSKDDKAIVLAALEQFDIAHLAAQRADTLSGGQQQRVAICRALVQDPEIVLADEPIASLDPRNTRIVMDALLRINKHFGMTVLCNLHSLDTARTYCDRLIGMASGKVVFDGVPTTLSNDMARELYGLEAGEVMDTSGTAMPAAQTASQPALVGA